MAKGEIACSESKFFFCHFVFKKPSAAEASESVYMRERAKVIVVAFYHGTDLLDQIYFILLYKTSDWSKDMISG